MQGFALLKIGNFCYVFFVSLKVNEDKNGLGNCCSGRLNTQPAFPPQFSSATVPLSLIQNALF